MITNTSFLKDLGLGAHNPGTWIGSNSFDGAAVITSLSPVDGRVIGTASVTTTEQYHEVVTAAHQAYLSWRSVPAPKEGMRFGSLATCFVKTKRP